MKIFEKLKKDKKLGVLIIIIFILGIFLRLNDFGEESFHSDCEAYFSPALLWFYPHEYYPGLSGQGEPALSHFFLGLGCISSGEDFSRISEIKPMFYPDRSILIGDPIVKSERNCHIPIYIFGMLFFILAGIFALHFLDLYGAAYFISFFAFYPFILNESRWIHLNIFIFFFSFLGIFFLFKAYLSKKGSKKELIYFTLASAGFALSFSSKTPGGAYAVFFGFILLEKYKIGLMAILGNIFETIDLKLLSKYKEKKEEIRKLIKILIYSIIAYFSVLFITFEFNFMNIIKVIQQYRSHSGDINAIGFNPIYVFKAFLEFLYTINIMDMIIFFFSIYILIKLIFKKEKSSSEKFILYLIGFLLILTLTFQIVSELHRVFVSFFFGIILLMALVVSKEEYSLTNLFKKKKKLFFYGFIIVYIILSFYLAYSDSPYFTSYPNQLLCHFNDKKCAHSYSNTRELARFMESILKENETFLRPGFINHYLRHEDYLIEYIFYTQFKSKVGREPNLEDYLRYYHPMNRTVRYVIVSPHNPSNSPLNLGKKYKPNYVFKIKNTDSKWIYDVQNLIPRE